MSALHNLTQALEYSALAAVDCLTVLPALTTPTRMTHLLTLMETTLQLATTHTPALMALLL